jgi:hypothetical protein
MTGDIAMANARVRQKRIYRSPATLSKLDQRTVEARLLREHKANLLASLPHPIDAITLALVDNAASVALRIELANKAAAERDLSAAEIRAYAQLTGLHQRLLRQLGQIGRAKPRHATNPLMAALAEAGRRDAVA